MKRTAKIVLLWFFIPIEIFFCLATFVAIFLFPPVGIIGLAASTLYLLVIISIVQSLKGKKPILNLFREGTKTCKKCGKTYANARAYSCPFCAEEKRKQQPPLPTWDQMQEAAAQRRARKDSFWNAVGTLMIFDELTKPKKKQADMWARMDNDGYIDHDPGNHDVDESGYCIDCNSNIEDLL